MAGLNFLELVQLFLIYGFSDSLRRSCEIAACLVTGPYVVRLTLHHIFDWEWFNIKGFGGWMMALAYIFNATATAGYLMLIVRTPGPQNTF